jgi:glucose 1-dehydrogenase
MATQTLRSTAASYRLEGKVAIITGGDEGIGRAIALRLAAEGADIAFCYRRNRAGANEVVDIITNGESEIAHGRRARAWQADVSNTAQAQAFIASAFDHFGAADILVNNAGLEKRANFWEVSEQDYDLVVNVNLKGVFFVTQAVVRRWIDTKHAGKIINISSVHEELPFPHFST